MGGSSSTEEKSDNNQGVLNGNEINTIVEIKNIDKDLIHVEYLMIVIILIIIAYFVHKLLKSYANKVHKQRVNQIRLNNLVPPQPDV